MKSETFSDTFGVGVIAMAALVAASGWIYGFAIERRAEDLMREVFMQPTAEYGPALAAGQDADEDGQIAELASGK